MAFTITHRSGAMDGDASSAEFEALLDELHEDPDDVEHADVALSHETGWSLGISRDRAGGERAFYVSWENVEDEDSAPRHMGTVTRADVLRLMSLVAAGRVDVVDAESWLSGY